MGAPLGNQNAAKAKLWSAAIDRAVGRLGSGKELDPNDDRSDYVKGIDTLADEFVKSRTNSGFQFFKELGDRTDGKPPQAIIGGDKDDPPISARIEWVIVEPKP